jgi:predicted Fe-Mo cluster-binding NifX family protein
MRIAIPTEGKKGLEEVVAYHFGRCATYTILDEKGRVVDIIDNISEHMGGRGLPPEILREKGVNILLCQGLGPRAVSTCEDLGVEVFIGQAEKVKDIFGMWKAGKLKKAGMEDVCEEHSM